METEQNDDDVCQHQMADGGMEVESRSVSMQKKRHRDSSEEKESPINDASTIDNGGAAHSGQAVLTVGPASASTTATASSVSSSAGPSRAVPQSSPSPVMQASSAGTVKKAKLEVIVLD